MVEKRTLLFNEELHKYTLDGMPCTSVTQKIELVSPKFDTEYWAKYKAKQLGTTPELIKQDWKDITDYACDRGNKIHKKLEDSINIANDVSEYKSKPKEWSFSLEKYDKTNLHILANTPLAEKYPKIYQYLRIKIEDGWTLFAEKKVYWWEYLIAGTIDCLLTKGKFFIIVDWKTNKDILMFKSGYYKKVQGIKTNDWVDKKEYMLAPLGHLEHCKGIKYTLQLSLYAHLVELWGLTCVGLVLFHIRNEEELKLYEIKYLQHAAEILGNFKPNTTNLTKFGINK